MKKLILTTNGNRFKNWIYYTLFDFYLWLSKFDKTQRTESRYFDHLGIIDTLGFRSDSGAFTYSYSDEFIFCWAFRIPFGYWIKATNYSSADPDNCIHLTKDIY